MDELATPPHLSLAELRERGHRTVDWIVDYLARIESVPVLSQVAPGEVRSRLPEHPPEHGEPYEAVLADLDAIVVPGLTHWQSPNFFAYFPANASGPAILGELLAAGFGVQGMLWATSPAATELETHLLDWLVELLDLPSAFRSTASGGGVIQDTASSATLCALLAARERTTGGDSNRRGVRRPLVAYASREAHSSVEKAVRIAGLGDENLRRLPVDADFAVEPAALATAIAEDRCAGREPCFAVATVGTTSTMAVDPLAPLGEICRRHGLWLHVDAAMAGAAAICPEHRGLLAGLELADSFCFNPHKWLLTNFDCDAFWVADRAALLAALSILPEYLRNQATTSGAVIDYRDWQVPLGRRFRALKLWLVLRHYGAEGLRAHIRRGVAWAQEFASWVAADADFELACTPRLSLVCFRHRSGDEGSARLLERVNRSGALYLSHTKVDGRFALRLAVGAPATERRHLVAAWRALRKEAADLAPPSSSTAGADR